MAGNKVMRVGSRLVWVVLVMLILAGMWPARASQAQAIAVKWEHPVNVSNTVGCSAQPAVAADDYGNVHVFWSEDTAGKRCSDAPVAGGSIYYSRRSGEEWSFPVDIITTTLTAFSPAAVADHTGRLHLVWVQTDGIFYSYAQAWAAATARAWTPPVRIVPSRFVGTMLQLELGPDSILHLIYSDWGSGLTPNDGNVYYVNSTDGGQTWSDPLQISDIAFGQQIAVLPRIAIDDQGTVHAVWSTIDTVTQAQLAVYYARRGKNDSSFTAPKTVMVAGKKTLWMMAITVAAVNDQILLTWACGEQPYRCYQVSLDRGLAWSSPQRVFGQLLSLANNDALAVDSAGKVYWVAQLRMPPAMYYSIWDRAQWSDPPTPFITSGRMAAGHAPAVAVGLGNQINLVMVDQDSGEIYYVHGITNAPAVAPQTVPTATPMPSPTMLPETTATPTAALESPTITVTTIADVPGPNGWSAEQLVILVAVVPAVILFAVAIYVRARRRR
jgi:hypothetical protein